MTKLSIIMPVYNDELHVKNTIKCLVEQTLKDIQIIIINDGSNDNSLKIIRQMAELDDRIIVVNIGNRGPGGARNCGLERATGEYVTFMDSDDTVGSGFYLDAINEMETKNADVIQTDYQVFDGESKKNIERVNYSNLVHENIAFEFMNKKRIDNYIWNKIFKSNVIKDIRFPELYYSEDQVFLAKVLMNANVLCFSRINDYCHYINPLSLCSQKFTMRKLDVFKAIDEISLFYDNNNINLSYFCTIDSCTYSMLFYSEIRKSDFENKSYLLSKMREKFKKNYLVYRKDAKMYSNMKKRVSFALFNIFPNLTSIVLNILNI